MAEAPRSSQLLPVVAGPLPEAVEVRLVITADADSVPAGNEKEAKQDKGRGAFSLRCFSAGSVVMREVPFVAVQDVSNRHRAWTCSHCFSFLQSLEAQMKWHRRQIEAILGEDDEGDVTPLPSGVLLHTDVVECWHACGEMYCSERCRDEAYAEHHEALCVGRVDSEQHPLVVFKKHAVAHNELFLLAAHVVARIFNTIRSGKAGLEYPQQFLDSFCHRPWLDVITAAQQLRKTAEEDVEDDEEDADFSPEMLKQLLDESYLSLRLALFSPPSPFSASELGTGLQELFTPEFYSHLLGLLEMNQNAIHIGSPLQTYAALLHDFLFPSEEPQAPEDSQEELPKVDSHTAHSIWERLSATSEQLERVEEMHNDEGAECYDDDESDVDHQHGDHAGKNHHDESEDEGDTKGKGKADHLEDSDTELDKDEGTKPVEMFPAFEGFGLFPIAAMMNHSCEPNTQVKFGRNREAMVVALRDIAEGEELTHSYIENDRPLAERQADLLEYNFECRCLRCRRESSA